MRFFLHEPSCFIKFTPVVLDETLRIFVMFNLSYLKHRQFTFCASAFEKFVCLKLKMIFWLPT
jgi:hypothetical protein